MVHLRAKNLPEKGKVIQWLFNDQEINFGDDFALIRTDDGQTVTIKSNYEGTIVKTVKLNSIVKNGGVLANIAVGEKERTKFKNRGFDKNDEEPLPVNNIFAAADSMDKLVDVEDELDNISGAVMYDKNYQANTPFSSGNDLMDTTQKFKELEEGDTEINKPKDKFAQMRANIALSIKNAPKLGVENAIIENKEELLKVSNKEAQQDKDLFKTNNSTGVSKFRKLINARRDKLLEDNDFKEVEVSDQIIGAMSKTDERGRPLIMRNIIANRLEKFNSSGGDPNVLEKDIIATNKNAILDSKDKKKLSPKTILMSGVSKYIKEEKNEVGDMYSAKKINANKKDDDVFMRQKASEDGQFGVTYGGYVDDQENHVIDANELSTHHGVVLPKKNKEVLLGEIKSKSNKSYAESKLTNLYDNSKRWNLIKERNERSAIKERMDMISSGDMKEKTIDVTEEEVGGIKIPQEFLKEIPSQDQRTGAMTFVKVKDTSEGKIGFENWLKSVNLFASYKEQQGEEVEEYISDYRKNDYSNQQKRNTMNMSKQKNSNANVQRTQELEQKIEHSRKELREMMDEKSGNETLEFLKSEIHSLKNKLEQSNKIKEANTQMVGNSMGNSGEMFNQIMQYMMMQSMIQSMRSGNPEYALKDMIHSQLNDFSRQFEGSLNQKINNTLSAQEQNIMNKRNFNFDQFSQNWNSQMGQNQNQMNGSSQMGQFDFNQQMNSMGQNQNQNQMMQELIKQNKAMEEVIKQNQIGQQNDSKISKEDVLSEMRVVDFGNNNVNLESIKPKNDMSYLNVVNSEKNTREQVKPNSLPAVKSMILSQSYIPPLTISTEVDMTAILKLKHVLKKTQNNLTFPTIGFITKALSLALESHPKINASYDPESNEVIIKSHHHIGLATETSEGLVIPVLKFVEKLSVRDVAVDIKEMTERLRRGELYNYETSGSTITLANYGNIGALQATPTIFYPNAAVVGVGKIVKKPVVVEQEKLAIKAIMNLSLTVDQRIIDSSEAGKFLDTIKNVLEKPELLTVS